MTRGGPQWNDSQRVERQRDHRDVSRHRQQEEQTPENWEDRYPDTPPIWKKKCDTAPPVRRPVQVENWFGLESSSDDTDSDNEGSEWSKVDRKEKADEKRRNQSKRKQEKMRDCASRAARMISIGPISMSNIDFFRSKEVGFEEAKCLAIKEFLQYNLGYSQDDLERIRIMDTRISTRGDDIMNVALATEDETREIYMRKAETRNSEVVVRNYIPPNFFKRYMHISEVCAGRRDEDENLKTQLRFGRKDVEVFIKMRGDESGFRKVNLNEFLDINKVPSFDVKAKWKKYTDRPPRRKASPSECLAVRPSMQGQPKGNRALPKIPPSKPLVRTNSNSTSGTAKKAKRQNEDTPVETVEFPDTDNEDMDETVLGN